MQFVTIISTCYHMLYHTFLPFWHDLVLFVKCYHNINGLPQALLYIFSQFSMVWGYLHCVTVKCIKKCTLMFWFFLNVGKRVAYSSKPGKSQIKYTVRRVVRSSSYGNALHYGLSIFVEIEKLSYPSEILISVKLNLLPPITKFSEHV